jgi:ubiquitin carboxyl-terminal hydrolase 10
MDASQQVLIETLPLILVLHMKRFLYDTKANGVIKIGKQVPFGPELEIQPDIIAPAARKTSQPTKYKLFGGKCPD